MDLVRKDGSSFPAVLSCSPEIQSDGGSERTIIVRDVTDRRRAEEALRESETRFRTLAGATFEGIAITENGRITDINEQFCKISGFDRSELLGMDVSKLVHPDDRDRILDSIVTGRESMVEHRLIRKDGSLIIVEAHGKTVRHDGRDRRLTAVRDITEARKAEETIRGAALFPLQNPEPVMRIHRDGTLLFSNPAARPVLAEWRTAHETRFPDRVHQAVEAALNEGVSREFEMQTAGRVFSFVIAPIAAAAYANLYGWDVTESKRAVAALKESEARYRGLFESMHEGFALHELLCDENGEPCDYRFLDVNPSFEQQTGLKRKDVIGRTVREVLPDIEPHWIKRYGEVALTGTPAHFESHSSALGRDYDIFAYRPAPGQFAVIFMDITNRRRAEQSLRASYELLKIAQRAANAGLWAWDVSTGTLTWSEEFYKLFGLEPEASASFDTWLGVLHPDDRQPAMEKINRSVRERAPLENEYRINRPDGEERWIRVWGSTFYDENGQPLNMSGVCIDATESVRAEEALRASEMRMKAVADHLPVGVWFADETGKIIYGNEAGRRIWAGAHYVDPEEFHVYRAWWADTDKPLGPEDWAVSRAVRKGETSLNEVLEIECFDGTRKTILNSAVPLRSSDGSLQGVVVLNEDITERKEAEGALRQNEARFRLLSETAGRLLATDDPQGLINELCRDVMEHLDCQAFFNFMVDERAGRLRLNACAGIPEEEVRKLEWLDYGVAVCGCVARDNVRIIAEDIFHTPDVRTDLVRSYGIQAYCCHPLRAQDRLIGTLSFGTKTRARFTPEEVDVMRTVADQVAVALQRIRAQQEIRKSQEALRLVNEELEQRVRERTTELILLLEDLEKSRDDLRKLASELVLTEERERKKISVTLHDEVAQTLAAARMRIDLLRSKPVDDESRHALDEAQQLLVQAIRETRSLMTDISNPVLYDMGLRVAVQSLTEEVKARNGISFSSSFGGSLRTLGQDMEVMIFLVVKELVQNIVKHSGARNASIGIVEERDDIKVIVTDDGQGFDVGSVGAVGLDSGFGLFSIRERVKSYNGKIRIESAPGKGSEVTVLLPKKAAGSTASRKTRKRKEQA
jgi:PAS domain S-box-containing protein